MAFDREKYKKKVDEIIRKKPIKIKGKFVEDVRYKITKKTLEDDQIKRIRVKDIDDKIDEYFKKGLSLGKKLNISELDNRATWKTGLLAIVTGIPSHGKSEFVDFLTIKLNLDYGWKTMYYSPENFPIPVHFEKIADKILGDRVKIDHEFYDEIKDYVNDNFSWIYYDELNTMEIILQTVGKYLAIDPKIKQLVIDPYNMIDVSLQSGETETLFINRVLGMLERFAKKHDILIFLVAHPRKMSRDKNNVLQVPNLYDIAGSAHFYNKADYGISVYRPEEEDGTLAAYSEIHFKKVRFKYLGSPGIVKMVYNMQNGRYVPLVEETKYDNTNWLESAFNLIKEETTNV